jgi:hypothetical protein
MRRRANYLVPLLATATFAAVRLLSPNDPWSEYSPVKVILGAICVALISYAICIMIDWVCRNQRSSRQDE